MAARPRRAARAFTLVELLVVIGIIAIVLSLLLPALWKFRRKAIVLASPIAYVGVDQRLHLTDPSGRFDLTLAGPAVSSCCYCHSPPAWSPSGQKIGFRLESRGEFMAMVDPLSGQITKHQTRGFYFAGWADSTRYIECDRNTWRIRDVNSGEVRASPGVRITPTPLSMAPAPPGAPGDYIACASDGFGPGGRGGRGGQYSVLFLRKNLSPGKRVWSTSTHVQWARIDMLGEWIAWSQEEGGRWAIALKNVNDPVSQPPAIIRGPYSVVYFCDWTEDGKLLGNALVRGGRNWQLVMFDRKGNVARQIATQVAPAEGVMACYRKYNHR